MPSASRRLRTVAGSRVPENAELPKRLRPNRAPSSSAQSISARVRGGRRPACDQARSTPTAAITPSAPSSQPPSGTESTCEPSASAGSRSPSITAQRFPAGSRSGSSPISASSSPKNARASRQVSVQHRRCAPSASPVRCLSSRRSATTRPASIAGAELMQSPTASACRGANVYASAESVATPAVAPRSPPCRLSAKGLAQAVRPAASEREHLEVGCEQLQAMSAHLLVQGARPGARQHPVVPQRDRVHPQAKRLIARYLQDLEALGLQPGNEAARDELHAHGGELRRQYRHQHVDVNEDAGDGLHPRLPSLCLKPGGKLMSGGTLGSLLAVADHDASRLDDHHVATLDRTGRGHAPDGNLALLVEANDSCVFPAAPPLLELGDVGAPRGHDARVAREHLVGQGWIRLEEVRGDAGPLVRRDELTMLSAGGVRVEDPAGLQRAVGDGARGKPPEVVGRTDEDVRESAVFGVDSPGRHSTTTLIVFNERSTAPLTQPPCSTTSLT